MLKDGDDEWAFWVLIRQALLLIIDAIERKLHFKQRTSELRKEKYQDVGT